MDEVLYGAEPMHFECVACHARSTNGSQNDAESELLGGFL